MFLQLFITIGTIVFGAFVAVKVFGLDVGGSSDYDRNTRGRGSRGKTRRNGRSTSSRNSKRDSSSGPSAIAGLLNGVLGGSVDSDGSDDGLIDVWFERKKSGNKGKKK